MNFGNITASDAVSGSLTAAANGLLSTPVNSFNSFLDKVASKLSPSRALIGRPYARQNVLQVMQQRGDPVLSFDWIGVIIDPTVNVGKQMPWQYIDGLTTPSLSVDQHSLFFNGLTKKFASVYSTGGVSLKLFTDVKAKSFNYANYWMRSSYREDGFYGLPRAYKKDIQVFILDATREIVVDLRFLGCFPVSWDQYTLDATNGILETTLQLSVDEMYLNYDSDFSAAKDTINGFANGLLNSAQQQGAKQLSSLLSF